MTDKRKRLLQYIGLAVLALVAVVVASAALITHPGGPGFSFDVSSLTGKK